MRMQVLSSEILTGLSRVWKICNTELSSEFYFDFYDHSLQSLFYNFRCSEFVRQKFVMSRTVMWITHILFDKGKGKPTPVTGRGGLRRRGSHIFYTIGS
jgi:hypothetical protein